MFCPVRPELQTTRHPGKDQRRPLRLLPALYRPSDVRRESVVPLACQRSQSRRPQPRLLCCPHPRAEFVREAKAPGFSISSMMVPTGVARSTSWLPFNAVAGSVCASSIAPRARACFRTGTRSQPTIRPLNPRFFTASPKEPPMRPVPMMVIWRIVIGFTTETRRHKENQANRLRWFHRVMAKDAMLPFVPPPGRSCATRPSISRTDRGTAIARRPREPCRDRDALRSAKRRRLQPARPGP